MGGGKRASADVMGETRAATSIGVTRPSLDSLDHEPVEWASEPPASDDDDDVSSEDAEQEEGYASEGQDDDDDAGLQRSTKSGRWSKSYVCEDCGKAYNKPAKLAQHVRTHTGERPYVCPVPGCGRAYMRNAHLSRHLNSQTHEGWRTDDQQIKLYQCDTPGCNKSYYNPSHLTRHKKTHDVPKPYVCTVAGCIMAYAKRTQLRQHHAIVHEGKSLYVCAVCHKSFSNQVKLDRHRACHEPRQCPIEGCDAVLPSWKEVRRHMAHHRKVVPKVRPEDVVHVEERKVFVCDSPGCGKAFTMRKNLRTHKRAAHGNQREFVCSVDGCGKAFNYKQVLERHVLSCHARDEDDDVVRPVKRSKKEEVARLHLMDRSSKEYEDLFLDSVLGVASGGGGVAVTA